MFTMHIQCYFTHMRAKPYLISLGVVLGLMTGAHAGKPVLVSPDKKLKAHIIAFADLSRWQRDAHEKALATFKRSCRTITKANQTRKRRGFMGTYGDWSGVCRRADKVVPNNRKAARLFFEQNFAPAQMLSQGEKSLFTGYFEPELAASLTRTKTYSVPLYRRPKDLRDGNQAYYTRAEIEAGALQNRGLEFVYLKNPVDAFFLHIQGSGRLFLDNGKILRVGFAGKNGRPYTAIGKVLIDRGEIARKNISMQSIRTWLSANTPQAAGVMQANQSFIFFKPLKNTDPNLGPPGAQGVPLTAQRSLAIDKTLHAYGMPMWVETEVPALNSGTSTVFHRLMVAQDTGSAIKGAIRGDIFWGSGKAAGDIAGKLKQPGKLYLLLPKSLVAKFQLKKS